MVNGEEILSTHIIKPSSPTPFISKTLQLSFLDQIGPPLYTPLIFFYPNPNFNHDKISQSLKQSLSKTLTHFYPLAGTLHENSFVDCDDSGVEFIDARVHSPLSWFVKNPVKEELRRLIPADSSAHTTAALLAVKLSFFDCGGFSVGVCCSHKIGDYASYVDFMNAWAAETRGGGEETLVSPPLFDLSLRFPPNPSAVEHYSEEKEKVVTKRLVFERETLEKIRGLSVCDEVKNPSRVEALSSFLWSIFIEATKAKRGPEKSSFAAYQAINLRPRSVPPIPDRTFGNCYVGQFAFTSNGHEICNLVSSLRGAIRSVDGDYIKNVVGGDEYLTLIDEANAAFKNGTTDLFYFSSWWRFPVYEVDFGWGKPSWVCTVAQPYKNLVIFMSTPQQDGIEAWINIPHDFSHHFDTKYSEVLLM